MIVFDLGCPAGHVFEAWFGSSEDYAAQQARGLVSCPLCGSVEIAKAMMAPRVGAKGNQRAAPAAPPDQAPQMAHPPAEMKAMLAKLAEAQARVLEGSAYVGRAFADQARAMHEGDRPTAPIHGEVSAADARALQEDGVPVAPLPLPFRPPGQDH